MTRARDIADLVDANGDIVAGALDNVPASNDASALTIGTLGSARLPTEIVSSDTTPQLGGNLDTNGNDITFGDNNKAIFGAGSDLQIYHDGGDSFIKDTGTGQLWIASDDYVGITNSAANEFKARFNTNGSVQLYYDNSEKLATTTTGVSVTGTLAATAFTGDGSAFTGVGAAAVGFHAYGNLGYNPYYGTVNVRLNQEKHDTDNGFNTSNYTYTVPSGKGGLWYLYAQCYFNDGSNITSNLYIYVNGTNKTLSTRSGSSGHVHSQQTSISINLSAGDTVNLLYYRSGQFNEQSIYEADTHTFLGGFRLG